MKTLLFYKYYGYAIYNHYNFWKNIEIVFFKSEIEFVFYPELHIYFQLALFFFNSFVKNSSNSTESSNFAPA